MKVERQKLMKVKSIIKIQYLTFIFILLSIVNCQLSIGQTDFTSSKKAFRYYEEAEKYLNQKVYSEAEKSLKKSIKEDKNFIEAYLMLGDVYHYEDMEEQAIESYKKAQEINPNKYPDIYFTLASSEFYFAKYSDARKHYEYYIQMKGINSENVPIAKKNLVSCDFAIEAVKHPVPFNPKNLGAGINSKYEEYFPCMTVDGKTLLYTRLIKDTGSVNGFGYNEDFYVSHYADSSWAPSQNIGPPINTNYNEGAPCLSPDGLILIFTACEFAGRYGAGRNGYGRCDLFFSRKVGNSWTSPINIGPPINSGTWESQPSYSSDGKTIYFIRKITNKNGKDSQAIYMSELGEDGKWKTPVKLGEKINAPGCKQESVFIHPDNQTLYFSSNRAPGMGGMDIFLSRKDKNGEWGEPENLGYPINTEKDENSFTVSGDGKTAFFASNRKGGFGGLDLYSFELPEKARPLAVTYMKGRIFDFDTKKQLYARFELIDLESGKTSVKSYSNKGNGEFLVCLPTGKNYALNVSADGYLFYSENFKLDEKGTLLKPVLKDIAMHTIKFGETVILKNIFFETAKFDLKPESQIELNKLIELLNKNPKMKIEISGHTDNVGGKDNNQTLSENRAKAVYNYLSANKISADRLTYKGYGDTKPIDSNDNEQGRANNRRTEFKVIGN